MLVASGVVDGRARGAQPAIRSDFEASADEAMTQPPPWPSSARRLKRVHADWFYAAFEALKGVADGPIRQRSAPLGASALAAPADAAALRDAVAAPKRQRRRLASMIAVRAVLQSRCG